MAIVCVVCHQEKRGAPVNDDLVIRSIRRIKKGIAGITTRYAPALMRFLPEHFVPQNNTLVVCKDCMEEHKKRRGDFEKNLVRFGALGFIMWALLVLFGRTLALAFFGFVIFLVMLLFALPYYHPSLNQTMTAEVAKGAGKGKKTKK